MSNRDATVFELSFLRGEITSEIAAERDRSFLRGLLYQLRVRRDDPPQMTGLRLVSETTTDTAASNRRGLRRHFPANPA